MDKKIIELLEFLKPHGLGVTVNCAAKLDELFPFPSNLPDYDTGKKTIVEFLARLRVQEYISYNPNSLIFFPFHPVASKWLPKGIDIGILIEGLHVLSDYHSKALSDGVNMSAIDTNQSIIATNESVQTTNQSIIKLSENQQTILDKQTLIFFFTAIFALGTFVLAGITLIRDFHKDTLQKQLQQLSKDTVSLHNRIKILKTDSSLWSEAKKNLPKKK